MLAGRQVATGHIHAAGQHAPHAVVGLLGGHRGGRADDAADEAAALLQFVLQHALGHGAGEATQHHAGHFVLERAARHHVHVHHFFQLEVGTSSGNGGQQWIGRRLDHGVGDAGRDQTTARGHGNGEGLGLARRGVTGFDDEEHVGHALAALPGEARARVQAAQAFFEHAGFGLELDGLAVAGRGQAGLVEHFVQKTGQVVRKRVLVAVLERQHFGIVQRLDGVAVEFLAARGGALGLCFFFSGQGFLGAELGNDGFTLVGALDVHTGVFKVAHGHAVERQARGHPHLFIVLALVDLQAFADQCSAHGAHEFAGVGLGGFFPFLDLVVGQQEGVGAVGVAAVHAQQLAAFHVVEQRGFFFFGLGRAFELGDGCGNAAAAAGVLHVGRQLVMALHGGAAREGGAQGQHPQKARAETGWMGGHECSLQIGRWCTRKPRPCPRARRHRTAGTPVRVVRRRGWWGLQDGRSGQGRCWRPVRPLPARSRAAGSPLWL